jgi:hypothetical protein
MINLHGPWGAIGCYDLGRDGGDDLIQCLPLQREKVRKQSGQDQAKGMACLGTMPGHTAYHPKVTCTFSEVTGKKLTHFSSCVPHHPSPHTNQKSIISY